jgi:hypothetical protein
MGAGSSGAALSDEGKPVVRLGRKATGLGNDSQVAGLPKKREDETVMRTVWNVSTVLDAFAQHRRQSPASVPPRAEVVRAIHHLLDVVVREPRMAIVDSAALVAKFNTLLPQVKEQFRGSDMLRLIEPVGVDASLALVAVRLSLVKRAVDAELQRSPEDV